MRNRLHTLVAWLLGLGALTFVMLLAGVGSGALTDDPPAVSPYASSDDGLGALEDGAPSYLPGGNDDEPATTTATAGAAITISGFAFGDPITVAAGTEVTVTNEDGAGHTWTSTDGLWDSGTLRGGDTFSFVFESAGTYRFFCGIHPSMTGTITVTG